MLPLISTLCENKMMTTITPNQLTSLFFRHIHLVGWIAFIVFNNCMLTVFLLVFWMFDLDGIAFYKSIQAVSQRLGLQLLWQVLSFWGLSGVLIFSSYALLWKKIYIKISFKYL